MHNVSIVLQNVELALKEKFFLNLMHVKIHVLLVLTFQIKFVIHVHHFVKHVQVQPNVLHVKQE